MAGCWEVLSLPAGLLQRAIDFMGIPREQDLPLEGQEPSDKLLMIFKGHLMPILPGPAGFGHIGGSQKNSVSGVS
jgi:hypothetical protein